LGRQALKWSVDRLAGQLCALGITAGDRLIVHTGLRATALLRDEVRLLLEAYRAVLGPEGALFFPTHTYSFKGIPNRPPFDEDAPCHPMIGAWPELARKAPHVVRSRHPTHSLAGIGRHVGAILDGHDKVDAVGFGSPLDKLLQVSAKVLMTGCGFESCTALHLAEVYADAPYLRLSHYGIDPHALIRQGSGIVEMPLGITPRCSNGFPKMEPRLQAAGLIRDGRLGAARAMLCPMERLVKAAVQAFRESPLSYLCDRDCLFCGHARSVLSRS
jgi:aminoglycoside 3-N-acetyltransferase